MEGQITLTPWCQGFFFSLIGDEKCSVSALAETMTSSMTGVPAQC